MNIFNIFKSKPMSNKNKHKHEEKEKKEHELHIRTEWLPPYKSVEENLSEEDADDPDGNMLTTFKDYLTKENPEWFKTISYSTNTVIDYYMHRHFPTVRLTKPQYRDFVAALAEIDSNFK